MAPSRMKRLSAASCSSRAIAVSDSGVPTSLMERANCKPRWEYRRMRAGARLGSSLGSKELVTGSSVA